MDELMEMITTIGFPMVACVAIYFDMRKDKDRMYDALDKFGDKLDKFDSTLQRIDARIGDVEKQIRNN